MNWEVLSAVRELARVVAVVISLLYVSRQIGMSNRLARAEASRTPTSDLNMLNASVVANQDFRAALRKAIEGVERPDFEPDDQVLLDLYLVSVTDTYEQLSREVREGLLDEQSLDFRGKGLFELPFCRPAGPYSKTRAGSFRKMQRKKRCRQQTVLRRTS